MIAVFGVPDAPRCGAIRTVRAAITAPRTRPRPLEERRDEGEGGGGGGAAKML